MSRVGESSGTGTAARIIGVFAESPRAFIARTGRVATRNTQTDSRFAARRSRHAGWGQHRVVHLAGTGARYQCFAASAGKSGTGFAARRGRTRTFIFPRLATIPADRAVFHPEHQPHFTTISGSPGD